MDRAEHVRWFAREVLPHEPDIRRWLAARVRGVTACDVDEVIQETYARVWSVDPRRISTVRAYLFVTARNIVGEALRRSRIVSIEAVADIENLNIVGDDITAERRLSGREEVERLHRTLGRLPAKCREAFELRKFEGLSQRDIAARMGIAESTVEKHLAKALRLVLEGMKESAEASTRSERADESRLRS